MRSTFRSLRAVVLTSSLTAAFTSVGSAQSTPAVPLPSGDASDAPSSASPGTETMVAPALSFAEAAPAVEATPASHWYDNFTVGGFVDAYGAIRSDNNRGRTAPAAPGMPASVANPVGPAHEAYVQASGFALAFAGADLAYSGEKFGATISMRFGPGVNRFYAGDQGAFGISNITQGFVTWKPTERLTLDLGQFYTIYGAEVAESWRNVNYSRGALYYAMQPFWHTGLRANMKLTDMLAINAMVVNGVNTAFEGNKSPSLGLQLVLTPTDGLLIAAGYLGGLHPRNGDDETAATKNFQDFFDLVGTFTKGPVKLVVNGDYNRYRVKGQKDAEYWWGASVAPAFTVTDWLTLGARVEYLNDSANSQLIQATTGKSKLATLTGTLDFRPVPGSAALILRPEVRYELAGANAFNDGHVGSGATSTDKFWSLHLGAVVTSMP